MAVPESILGNYKSDYYGGSLSHRWYVVNTHSGFEKKVSQVIKEQAERKGLSDSGFEAQVLVPMEEVKNNYRSKVPTQRTLEIKKEKKCGKKIFSWLYFNKYGYD